MSVAGSGGRRAGLTEATEAWAWRSGAHPEPAAPSNRGPKPADRGSERGRASTRAHFPPTQLRGLPRAPRPCPHWPGCPSPWGGKRPPNKETSPAGPGPCSSAWRVDPSSLNVDFPVSGRTLFLAQGFPDHGKPQPLVSYELLSFWRAHLSSSANSGLCLGSAS